MRWARLLATLCLASVLGASARTAQVRVWQGEIALGKVVRLSLLRSPAWPDPHADEGFHRFTYSIYPHMGGWERGGTARLGYELNYPLLVRTESNHDGPLPSANSFLSIDSPFVFLTAMKKAEDDDSLILRFVTLGGENGEANVTLPRAAADAAETDLMERALTGLAPEENKLRVAVRPYEIKTIKARFGPTK